MEPPESKKSTLAFGVAFLFASFVFAEGTGSLQVPQALVGTEIIDKLGSKVDANLVFTRHDEKRVPLSVYFGSKGKKALPAIVTIGYFECPMLCSLVLNATLDTLGKMKLKMGEDYRVLSFSINPKEKSDLAANKRRTHLKALDKTDGAWDFFTSDDGEEVKLAQTLGFGYKFDKPSGEFAHGAGIFILTPDGVLSRTLWGLNYDPWTVKLALMEAAGGKVGTVVDKIILSCFHYEPDSHKYGFYIFGIMRIGATLTVVLLGSMLAMYWAGERRRRIGIV
jgi:protein SCO1/2